MAQDSDCTHDDEAVVDTHHTGSWLNPFTWIRSWRYSSMAALAVAERRILSSLWDRLEHKFIRIGTGREKRIRTISLNTESQNVPLVMVHGMGAGVGFWILNLEAVATNRPVHAFDVLGFGRSSRPRFSTDPLLAELEFVESVEDWRKGMKLDKFVLLGHSLGGFIATSYAIRYPERVRHLILVDPWGFPEKPVESKDGRVPVPIWIRAIAKVLQPFNPLAVLRAAGPWGPDLVTKFRSDIIRKFGHLFEDDTVSQYIFHCNAQTPSGEMAFKHMTIPFGWAKYPMIKRVTELPRSLPMTAIYGSRSWVDSGIGYEIKYLRNESYVDVQVIKGAGHHVYADKAYQFNTMVTRVCQVVDNHMDFGQPFIQPVRRRSRVSESNASPLSHEGRRYHSESMPTFSKIQTTGSDNWEGSYHRPKNNETLVEASDKEASDKETSDNEASDRDTNDIVASDKNLDDEVLASGDQAYRSSKVTFSIGSEHTAD